MTPRKATACCKKTLTGLLVLLLPGALAAADGRRAVIDDMMSMRHFESVAIDPSGRWAVYELVRPYDQFLDYSAFSRMSGQQLWRYDLSGTGEPEPLPGVDREPNSYQLGFSPSGKFLTVMQYRFGELSLGAYDVSAEEFVKFKLTPALSRPDLYSPAWISDDELVYAALPEGESPTITSVRPHAGNSLFKAWGAAWTGTTVTAREVRTIPTYGNEQENGHLVRADARTGRSQIIASGLYADIRVSPDGRWLAALEVSKPRPLNPERHLVEDTRRYSLIFFDLETGEIKLVAPEIEFSPYTVAWAPDGQSVAAFGWRADETSAAGRFYVVDLEGVVTRFDHFGLDLVSERERGAYHRPERTAFLENVLAVFARKIPETEDQSPRFSHQSSQSELRSKPDWYAISADGTSTNLTDNIAGVSGVPIHAGQTHFTVWSENGVYRLYADGQRRRLTPELSKRLSFQWPGIFPTWASVIRRPEFTREVMFKVRGEGGENAMFVDMREGHEGEVAVVESPAANSTPVAGSLSSGLLLSIVEHVPFSQLLITDVKGQSAPREITSINGHFANIDLGKWEIVSYELEDPEGLLPSRTVESCVLLPPGYTPQSPPPLIVEVYPGVGPSCKSGVPRIGNPAPRSPYLWAANGYAFARLTTPRDLIHTSDGPISGIGGVISAGVDALIESGFADAERLALYGFSQGGISALYVASRRHRFKAIIAVNSWANLLSHYFGSFGIHTYFNDDRFGNFGRYEDLSRGDFAIGRTAFDDPDAYIRNSPVIFAPRIDVPVLLIHSDMDSFSMSQFDEMYGALLRAGKDARYVRYLGEGHGPSSPANIRDMWDRKLEFLGEQGVGP